MTPHPSGHALVPLLVVLAFLAFAVCPPTEHLIADSPGFRGVILFRDCLDAINLVAVLREVQDKPRDLVEMSLVKAEGPR